MTKPSSLPPILTPLKLSDPQMEAALLADCDIAVTAGAGTGKTRTLVARYLALLANGVPLRRIAAVTFTRKAAREMRNRVRSEISAFLDQLDPDDAERGAWQAQFDEMDAARIGTIHNLCGEILRTHPAEAQIDPRFAILDETEAALLMQESAEAALAWAVESEAAAAVFYLLGERMLLNLLRFMLGNRLEIASLAEQIPANSCLERWQAMLRDAQSEAVSKLLTDPAFVDALRDLRRNEAVKPDDKREQQRRMVLTAVASLDQESLEGKLRHLAILKEINLRGGSVKAWPNGKAQFDQVKNALETVRECYQNQTVLTLQLNEQDKALAEAMSGLYALFDQVCTIYSRKKSERDALDFADLESETIRLLETDTAVCQYWQNQIDAVLVDEFQDTNELQRRFVRLLCPNPGKLFIVGDVKQSIYRFRGADVAVFAKEQARIRRDAGRLVELATSYRAHDALLHAMNNMMAKVLGPDSPERPPWAAPFAPLSPSGRSALNSLTAPFIEFHLTLGKKREALPKAADALAARLIELNSDNGIDFGDVAILCRASNAFQYYENALDAAGIPYVTVSGKGFYDRPEVRDSLNALRAIADPHDDVALAGLLRSPACGLSDVSLYWLNARRNEGQSLWETLQVDAALPDEAETTRLSRAVALIHDLNKRVGRRAVADIYKQFLDRTFYRAMLRLAGQQRALRNINKLLNDIHASERVHVSDFLTYAETVRDSGSREGEARATFGGAVQIMTIHASKGLEFPVVVLGDAGASPSWRASFLVDNKAGLLLNLRGDEKKTPCIFELCKATTEAQEEAESARLLYVALTRAEQMVLISGNGTVNKSGPSWRGWLNLLTRICGLNDVNLDDVDAEGDAVRTFALRIGETAVCTTLYEPYAAMTLPAPKQSTAIPVEPPSAMTVLQQPVLPQPPSKQEQEENRQRVWQIVPTAKRPTAPAWVVGTIVHQALAQWRFPDELYTEWATAQALEFGLTDPAQLRHASTESARLLNKFRQHPLCDEIARAGRRLHEVPYSYRKDGTVESGYIDLLYEDSGTWTVVDFKTDAVWDETMLQTLLVEKDYVAQLERYETAVKTLLGAPTRHLLVFLNWRQGVKVMEGSELAKFRQDV